MRMTVTVTRRELSAAELRREAVRCREAAAARRMLALALVLEGRSREAAARAAGMDRQTLRDWVHRYNVYGRPPPCKGVLPTWLASSVRAARVYPASHAA
jgi:transposase-like protein